MTTFRDRALALASEGYRVFPLVPNGKTPALETDWRHAATADPARVSGLWTCSVTGWDQPYNIGVALDTDTVVVDVDIRDGKRGAESLRRVEMLDGPLPETYTVRTASGGEHRYLATAARDSDTFPKELAEHIDLKGAGGYVVGEGSEIDGRPYTRIAGQPSVRAAAPECVTDLPAAKAPRAGAAAEALVDLDSDDALRRAAEWLRGEAPDHGTFKIACHVKDFGVSEDACFDLMLEHWRDARDLGKDDDHIRFRVGNAYRYGESPIGIRSAEAEFAPVELEDRRTKAKRPKLYFEPWRETTVAAEATWLIEGWYDRGAMVVTYGESNAGKSHVVLSQAVAVARGAPWAEARVRQGLVVYVAAEGARGFRKRIEAYKRRHELRDIPFAFVPCPIDLLRPAGDTKPLVDLIRQAEATFGQRCAMVVVDTLFRALAGGNENAPEDMGALVRHCDQIREATGATLHLIHHSGKNAAAGARGHSSLRAATDTEIEVAGDQRGGEIKSTKQRDMERSLSAVFDYETVDIGVDSAGTRVRSAVANVRQETEFEPRVTVAAERFLAVLAELEADNPDKGDGGIAWQLWWKSGQKCKQERTCTRQSFEQLRKQLQAAGLVIGLKGNQWVTVDAS